METDQPQQTVVEEMNKTVENTVDGDKTVETSVVEETKTNEIVMNEDSELKIDEQNAAPVDESVTKEPETVSEVKESDETSKVDEVEMADPVDQVNKSVEEEPAKEPSTDHLKEPVFDDVHMDQVISDVKDSVVEKSDDSINVANEEKNSAKDESVANLEEPIEQNDKVDEQVDAKVAEVQPSKKPKLDLGSMQTRQYLDHTVVPILLAGLSSLAKARPENPIEYLASYLLDNKNKCDNNQENQSLNGN